MNEELNRIWGELPVGSAVIKGPNGEPRTPFLPTDLPKIVMLPDKNRNGYFFFFNKEGTVPRYHPAVLFEVGTGNSKSVWEICLTHGYSEKFLANGEDFSVAKVSHVTAQDMFLALPPLEGTRLKVRAQLVSDTGTNAMNRFARLFPQLADVGQYAQKAIDHFKI